MSNFMGQVLGEGSHVGTEVMGAALQGIVLVNKRFLGGAGDGSWGLALPQQSPEWGQAIKSLQPVPNGN